MTIAEQTRIQAYQLKKGGTPARMAILRMIAADSVNNRNEATRLQPGDWKGARSYTLASYEGAYGLLAQGKQGTTPIWYSHGGEEFRDEREASNIVRYLPDGWYTDTDCSETAIGIVARLPHGRFIAGYRWTSNGERVYFPEVFTDEDEAARAADSHAESFADDAREDSERFEVMSLAELDAEEKTTELQKAVALRHRTKFGGPDRVREVIEALREARAAYDDAVKAYERG